MVIAIMYGRPKVTWGRRLLAGTLLSASVGLAACGSAGSPPPSKSAPSGATPASAPAQTAGPAAAGGKAAQLTPITIGVPVAAEPFTDDFVARDLGIFAKHGLAAKIIVMKPPTAFAALTTGALTFWAGVGSGAKAAETGRPVRGVFLSSDAAGLMLVGAKGVTALQQIRGKTVASKSALDTNTLTAQLLLSQAGVPTSAYRIDYAGTTGAQTALLEQGTVAAAMLELGPALKLKAAGYKIIGNATSIRLFGSGLVTSTQEIQQHPNVMRKSVAAMKEAVGLITTQKPQVLSVMEKEFHDSPSLASQIYDIMLPTWIPSGLPPAAAAKGEISFDTNALQAAQVKLSGTITESSIFDTSFVKG